MDPISEGMWKMQLLSQENQHVINEHRATCIEKLRFTDDQFNEAVLELRQQGTVDYHYITLVTD